MNVYIAIPGGRDPTWDTAVSLIQTIGTFKDNGIASQLGIQQGCYVTHVRNQLVELFLKSDCNRILWLDDDMEWRAEDILRLLALTTKVDIVGIPCVMRHEIVRFNVHADTSQTSLNECGLLKVNSVGFGCICMTREVVESVVQDKPIMVDTATGRQVHETFRLGITDDGHMLGEDVAFCFDARDAGYDVWVDPSIQCNHIGRKKYTALFSEYIGLAVREPRLEVA